MQTTVVLLVLAPAAASAADRRPPKVRVIAPVAGASVTGVTTLAASASDRSGVREVRWYVDGNQVSADTNGEPWAASWNSSAVGNGQHSLVAKAVDRAGNWGTSASVVFSVFNATAPGDTTRPTVAVTSPIAGATLTGTVTLAASAFDNVAVTQAKWYVDGNEVAWDGNGAPWQHSWNSATVADGDHRIFAKAADAAGNWGTSASVSFKVSNGASGADAVVFAAGDYTSCSDAISCLSSTAQKVRDVMGAVPRDAILGLGDFQYQDIGGVLNGFDLIFGPKPGGLFSQIRPTAGPTHDVTNCTDTRYQSYFGRSAMQGYSFNVGNWHIISLPSAAYRYGCDTSGVLSWLNADLNADTHRCTLAFWHEPYWTRPTSIHQRTTAVRPWVQALYDHNAELVLSGHQHNYQRFAPQDPNDQLDPARGIRQFVVGTGGIGTYAFTGPAPNVEASDANTFGALKLTLHSDGYDFMFQPAAGGSFTDAGSGSCH